jgi:hypothetical protein
MMKILVLLNDIIYSSFNYRGLTLLATMKMLDRKDSIFVPVTFLDQIFDKKNKFKISIVNFYANFAHKFL